MNFNPQTPGTEPEQNQQNQNMDSAKPSGSLSIGSTIGILVIIIILGIMAFFFWGNKTADAPGSATEQDSATTLLQTQGNTDDTASIEADLSATALDSLDADLGQVDLELQ